MAHASDSTAQRDAEHHLINILNNEKRLKLAPEKFPLDNSIIVQLDGIDKDNKAICEAFAHIGKLKPAQSRKVTSDMLKLLLVEKNLGGGWRKFLCFADEDAAIDFQGNTWRSKAITEFGFEIFIAKLSPDIKEKVAAAQRQQNMVNA